MRFRHPNLYMSFYNLRLNTRSCAGDILPERMRSICQIITDFSGHVWVSHPDPDIEGNRTYFVNIHKRCRWMMEYPCEFHQSSKSPAVIMHPEDPASLLVLRNVQGGLEIVTYGRWEEKNAEFAKYMTQTT